MGTKGIDVDRVVVVATEELWGHVDGGANNAARHHRLRLTETQVSYPASVSVFCQLKE